MIPAPFDAWNPLEGWTFETLLGAGGQGVTLRAASDSKQAAIKCLRLGGDLSDQRVRREAEVLEALDHPNIPACLGSQEATAPDGQTWFFLIQEYVSGDSLQDRIDHGVTMSDAEARAFLREMLETLEYLHGQEPPVLHRDIKPTNIILRDEDCPVLVDYGAAGRLTDLDDGDAIIGTAGYLPPEQYFGSPVPASDLYGLAATVLHAVSHRHPSEFPADGLTIRFDRRTSLPDDLHRFLETALNPDPDGRFSSAADALDSLDRRAGKLARTEEMHHATLEETPDGLQITADSRPAMTGARRSFLIITGLLLVTSFAGGSGLAGMLSFALAVSLVAATFSLFAPGGLGANELFSTKVTLSDDSLLVERRGPLGIWNDTTEVEEFEGLTLVETRYGSHLSHYGGDLGPLSHNLLPSENETIRRRLEDWSERE